MLTKFEVENFLSFKEKQILDLTAKKVRVKNDRVYVQKKNRYLKFATIFGANASGKSNLITAIDFMKNRIIKDDYKSTQKYFKNDIVYASKPSLFNIVVLINQTKYVYGFKLLLNENKYTEEWLYEETPTGTRKKIFTRLIEKGIIDVSKKYIKNEETLVRLLVYGDDIKDDQSILFLQLMNKNKNNLYVDNENKVIVFNTLFNWFRFGLNINFPTNEVSEYSYFFSSEKTDNIIKFIKEFDTGITNFVISDLENEQIGKKIPQEILSDIYAKLRELHIKNKDNSKNAITQILLRGGFHDFFVFEITDVDKISCKTIKFNHENTDELFELSEESDGTIRILDLLEVLLDESVGSVYIIDELDRFLHPLLTYKFVKLFLELAKERCIQLIVTTHEQRLLNFDLLRRDEIWFTEKGKLGNTNLYDLYSLSPRADKKLERAYLDGDFGAIPFNK
ncbi:MAG: AAA family ATPase [Bacilli bacterium]